MKRGKETRTAIGEQTDATSPNEIMALPFVMVEQAPGAFSLRFVANDDLLENFQKHGMLQSFHDDIDKLYTEFREGFANTQSAVRPN